MNFLSLRKFHFILALVLAVPLTISSITGALLVYGAELQRLVSPAELWTVEPGERALPLQDILASVSQQRPDFKVWSLSVSEDNALPYRAWLSGGKGAISIDQYTGRILHHFDPDHTVEGWITALHRRWLSEGSLSRWVRHAVALTALLLIVELVLGVLLWLVPPRPFSRLALSRKFSLRYNVLRLHQLSGLVTALVLVVIAFTGMSFYWDKPVRKMVEGVFGEKVLNPTPPAFTDLKPLSDMGEALRLAREQIPQGRVSRIQPPDREDKPALIVISTDNQTQPSQVWVGDNPARVLYLFDGRKPGTVSWLWVLRYDIHYGHFAGDWLRPIWVVVALSPAAFVISGIWLYLKRRRPRPRAAMAMP